MTVGKTCKALWPNASTDRTFDSSGSDSHPRELSFLHPWYSTAGWRDHHIYSPSATILFKQSEEEPRLLAAYRCDSTHEVAVCLDKSFRQNGPKQVPECIHNDGKLMNDKQFSRKNPNKRGDKSATFSAKCTGVWSLQRWGRPGEQLKGTPARHKLS